MSNIKQSHIIMGRTYKDLYTIWKSKKLKASWNLQVSKNHFLSSENRGWGMKTKAYEGVS